MYLEPPNRTVRAGAFTLIELLCSIGIVALLVVLLIPAFSKLQLKAKQFQCSSQLHSTYHAIALYANDHEQYYPPTYGSLVDPSATWWWYQDTSPLAEYAGGANAWATITMCPLNRTANIIASNSHVKGYSYVVNYNVMATTGNSYKLRKMASVPVPSTIVLMSDSVANSSWGWGFDNTDPNNPTGGFTRMFNTHQGKANLLWCDGHVTCQALNTLVARNSLNINLRY